MEFIEAHTEHYSAIRQIADQTWPETFKHILSPDQIKYMLEMMYSEQSIRKQVNEQGHVFVLAQLNNEYLGYTSYQTNYASKITKLHKIYVLPQKQGLGIGAALMQWVEKKTKEAGDCHLRLNVNRDNKAVRFYEKNGFSVIAEEDIPIGNGYFMNDYVMQKELI